MIAESIVLIILAVSVGGILLMIIRKMPALNSLPQNGNIGIREHRVFVCCERKIKGVLNFFDKQIFLHKLLSWVKVLTLKIETKVDGLLHRIRKERAEKK